MKYFFSIILFCLFANATFGQCSGKISVQANSLPSFRINSATHEGGSSQGILLSVSYHGTDLGLRLFRGYDNSIDFSYGVSAGLTFAEAYHHKFKGGMHLDRIYVNDYKRNYDEIGGIIEDDMTESFQPYLEWEWAFSKPVSFFTQIGYRLMRSETSRVTDIKYYTHPVTGEKDPFAYKTDYSQSYYGAGFEVGIGLSMIIY